MELAELCWTRQTLRGRFRSAPEASRGRSGEAWGALGELSGASGDAPGTPRERCWEARRRPEAKTVECFAIMTFNYGTFAMFSRSRGLRNEAKMPPETLFSDVRVRTRAEDVSGSVVGASRELQDGVWDGRMAKSRTTVDHF